MSVFETNKIALYVLLYSDLKSRHDDVKIQQNKITFNVRYEIMMTPDDDSNDMSNNVKFTMRDILLDCSVSVVKPWFDAQADISSIIYRLTEDLSKETSERLILIYNNVIAIGTTMFPSEKDRSLTLGGKNVSWYIDKEKTVQVTITSTTVTVIIKDDKYMLNVEIKIGIDKFTPMFFTNKVAAIINILKE